MHSPNYCKDKWSSSELNHQLPTSDLKVTNPWRRILFTCFLQQLQTWVVQLTIRLIEIFKKHMYFINEISVFLDHLVDNKNGRNSQDLITLTSLMSCLSVSISWDRTESPIELSDWLLQSLSLAQQPVGLWLSSLSIFFFFSDSPNKNRTAELLLSLFLTKNIYMGRKHSLHEWLSFLPFCIDCSFLLFSSLRLFLQQPHYETILYRSFSTGAQQKWELPTSTSKHQH